MDVTIMVGARVAIVASKYHAEDTDGCGGTVRELSHSDSNVLVAVDGGKGEIWLPASRVLTQARAAHNAELRSIRR